MSQQTTPRSPCFRCCRCVLHRVLHCLVPHSQRRRFGAKSVCATHAEHRAGPGRAAWRVAHTRQFFLSLASSVRPACCRRAAVRTRVLRGDGVWTRRAAARCRCALRRTVRRDGPWNALACPLARPAPASKRMRGAGKNNNKNTCAGQIIGFICQGTRSTATVSLSWRADKAPRRQAPHV